jgi:hypothetical protein
MSVYCVHGATNDAAQAQDAPTGIAVIQVGELDPEVLARIADFLSKQYMSPVSIKDPLPVDLASDKHLPPKLAMLLSSNDVCLLALVQAADDISAEGAALRQLKLAIVNTTALKPNPMDSPEATERYVRRIEKESIAMIALCLDLPTCILPRCALLRHQTEEQLDSKARNLCPPCRRKALDALKRMGVKPTPPKPPPKATPSD